MQTHAYVVCEAEAQKVHTCPRCGVRTRRMRQNHRGSRACTDWLVWRTLRDAGWRRAGHHWNVLRLAGLAWHCSVGDREGHCEAYYAPAWAVAYLHDFHPCVGLVPTRRAAAAESRAKRAERRARDDAAIADLRHIVATGTQHAVAVLRAFEDAP